MFYSRARRYGPLIQPILIGQNLWPYKRIPLYSFSELLLDLQKSHHYQKGQPVLEALRSLILHSYLGLDLDRENNVWTDSKIIRVSRLVRILFAMAAVSLSTSCTAELSLFMHHSAYRRYRVNYAVTGREKIGRPKNKSGVSYLIPRQNGFSPPRASCPRGP